jgi:Fe-S-cluster-containing dehydrogenase component
MDINRRNFLKVAAGGGLMAAANLTPALALAREPKTRPPEALGILYDATVCIGCKACVSACKQYNSNPPVFSTPQHLWDNPVDLNAYTYNIIKLYKNGSGKTKDQEKDGYSYIKRHCMHCVDPSCISACPVSALTKDPKTGIVHYDKGACIGCRYCQVACPYLIPKFQWDQAFPQIRKCQLCDHRIQKGGISACCEFCPTGASVFGKVGDLLQEAKRRLTLKPGEYAYYPISTVTSSEKSYRLVKPYLKHVYGEREGGGTQFLMLANVPFEKLGLPALPDYPDAAWSEGLQHGLYKGMIAPAVVLAGLLYVVYKNTKKPE